MRISKHIPNTLTLLNLLCGSLSAISALSGNLNTAVYLVIAAALLDFADGFSARMLKAYSPIGKELDSLADLVSFGLAPSFMLIYQLSSYTDMNLLIYIPLVITLASALRLAIFNVDTSQTTSFTGLPAPSSALLIVMFTHVKENSSIMDNISSNIFFYPVISIVLSYLLISKIPMFSLKVKDLSIKKNLLLYRFFLISLILLIPVIIFNTTWSFWIMLIFVAYILYNILIYLFKGKDSPALK